MTARDPEAWREAWDDTDAGGTPPWHGCPEPDAIRYPFGDA